MNYEETKERCTKKLKDLLEPDFTLLSEYSKRSVKVQVKHNQCGYIWSTTPSSLYVNHQCPACCKRRHKKTNEIFEKEVMEKGNGEYELMDNYCKSDIPVHIRHTTCGYIWNVRPASFIQRPKCPHCSQRKKVPRKIREQGYKTPEKYSEWVTNTTNGEYTVLSKYTKCKNPVKIRHNECGYEWNVKPEVFRIYKSCPKCSAYNKNKNKPSHHEFQNKLEAQINQGYKLINECKNAKSRITVRHLKCGHEWNTYAWYFVKHNDCPECRKMRNIIKRNKAS